MLKATSLSTSLFVPANINPPHLLWFMNKGSSIQIKETHRSKKSLLQCKWFRLQFFSETPLGFLPVLSINGNELTQKLVIDRFLAGQFGMSLTNVLFRITFLDKGVIISFGKWNQFHEGVIISFWKWNQFL